MEPLLANLMWISPLWGWAMVAAVGIPLLAHLLNRRRYRTIVFPAVELLREAVIRTTRMRRPRHLLLLLLRALALALIVLGFMRPIWQSDAVARPVGDGQLLVIVLDASASMQRTVDGRSAFDQARDRAEQLMHQLEPGRDRASVYLLTDRLEPLLPESTGNLTELRRRLAEARCTWQSDRPEAVGELFVERVAQLMPTAVAWISDGQHVGEVDQVIRLIGARVSAPAMEHIRVGQPLANASVRLQDVRPYPPITGQPMSVTVSVQHAGDTAVQRTLVLNFADQQVRQQLTLEPRADHLVTLQVPELPEFAGWLTVGFEEADGFTADDRTGVLLSPQPAPPVLLLTDQPQNPLAQRIRAMLAPAPADHTTAPAVPGRNVRLIAAATDLARLNPSSTLVIFGLREPLTQGSLVQIELHLAQGGGVVWMADSAASRRNLNAQPGPITFSESDETRRIVERALVSFDLEALHVFEGPARGMLAGLAWPGVHDAALTASAQSLVVSTRGVPIVAGQAVGLGTLYVVNADAQADNAALTLDPAIVVLFNELVRLAAAGQAMPTPLYPGHADPVTGEMLTQTGPTTTGRWVELDPRECDLFHQDGASANESAGAETTDRVATITDNNLLALGKPLWPLMLLGGLMLFAAEAGVLIAYHRADGRGVLDEA